MAVDDKCWTLLIMPRDGNDDEVLAEHELSGLREREVRTMFGLRRGRVPRFLPIPVDAGHLRLLQPYANTALEIGPDAIGELWRRVPEAPADWDASNSQQVRSAAKAVAVYALVAAALWGLHAIVGGGWARTVTLVLAWVVTAVAAWCAAFWAFVALFIGSTRRFSQDTDKP